MSSLLRAAEAPLSAREIQEQQKLRREAIYAHWCSTGKTSFSTTAKAFSLSRERVRQVIYKVEREQRERVKREQEFVESVNRMQDSWSHRGNA